MQGQSVTKRPRRLRQSPLLRDWVAEHHVAARNFMLPHFVLPGVNVRQPIASMPGIERLSVDLLVRQVEADLKLGIRSVLLFGVPDKGEKDPTGSASGHPEGIVPSAVRALKKQFGHDLIVGTDVCLCAYTDHGHCGIITQDGVIDNDASLPHLCSMALAHAQAGADIVGPSDMMDGRIGALRRNLDHHELTRTLVMAYSVKYASAYYGPFREAAGSAPGKGDRKTYQMDPRNVREARREAKLDEKEGADILMVKPALAYLDVVAAVRAQSELPLACYNVSGEYSMVKAAAERGWVDERALVMENLTAMRRAGADVLITYHARDVLKGAWL